jgi:hypothetical protein
MFAFDMIHSFLVGRILAKATLRGPTSLGYRKFCSHGTLEATWEGYEKATISAGDFGSDSLGVGGIDAIHSLGFELQRLHGA